MTTNKPASEPQGGRVAPSAVTTEQGWPRKVRTTTEPDKVVEVGPAEYADLAGWGLIKSEGN